MEVIDDLIEVSWEGIATQNEVFLVVVNCKVTIDGKTSKIELFVEDSSHNGITLSYKMISTTTIGLQTLLVVIIKNHLSIYAIGVMFNYLEVASFHLLATNCNKPQKDMSTSLYVQVRALVLAFEVSKKVRFFHPI